MSKVSNICRIHVFKSISLTALFISIASFILSSATFQHHVIAQDNLATANTNPVWSPDGESIAYISNQSGYAQVWIMDAKGSNRRNITAEGITVVGTPAWSADGQYIAVESGNDLPFNGLVLIKADGSQTSALETGIPKNEYGITRSSSPTWGPTDCCIAVITTWGNRQQDVWLVYLDGSEPVNLTKDDRRRRFDIKWSPDGNSLVFSAFYIDYPDNKIDIWIMNANGAGLINLTPNETSVDIYPTWSPSGHQILFTSNRSGSDDIWVMDEDGTNSVNITPNTEESNERFASWSPDECCIVFSSNRSGRDDIWLLDIDNNHLTNLTADW